MHIFSPNLNSILSESTRPAPTSSKDSHQTTQFIEHDQAMQPRSRRPRQTLSLNAICEQPCDGLPYPALRPTIEKPLMPLLLLDASGPDPNGQNQPMASPTELPGLPPGAADPCVHCGFCLPTCASYRVLANEMDSPRGRIHALRAIAAGELELDATVASHFDTCLGCFACVTACPSGVRYDQLIEHTRPKLINAGQRSPWQTSFRRLLLQVLPYPGRLRALLQPLRAYAGTPAPDPGPPYGSHPFVRSRNRSDGAVAAALGSGGLQRSLPQINPAIGESRGRVALLLGCVQRCFDPKRQHRNGEGAAGQRL